ncbi:MAG: hypothetical protein LWX07_10560 [Bacteroidetes bacterium]|nr:hypothetical protein [Bacteroidota bacterium]
MSKADAILSSLTRLKTDIIDFVFPKICIVTDERLPDDNSNDFIADTVLSKIEKAADEDLTLIKAKINSDFYFSKYAFRHDNEVQTLIHYLKYKGFSKIGAYLGELIGESLVKKFPDKLSDFGFLVPVPLFDSKERERGFNQSMYICRGLSRTTGLEVRNDIIYRKRYTKSQTGLSTVERARNVRDAFGLKRNINADAVTKGIIVVDDVITTGSTTKEVIRTLKQVLNVKIGAVSVCIAKD